MNERVQPPAIPFLGAPTVADLADLEADVAFLGVPYGVPYEAESARVPSSDGPNAVRAMAAEQELHLLHEHWDVDCEGPLVPPGVRVVDCGDVAGDDVDWRTNRERAVRAVAAIVQAGAIPLVVGGDDSIPPIVADGFANLAGGVNVLHVDAHVDFRDERDGTTEGYSSPIRRLRERPFVGEIVQVGLRGIGSARRDEWEAAHRAGNRIITAETLHAHGPEWLLDQLPDDRPWFVTIDCDGLDPSVAPGVRYPEPDGLSYREIAVIVRSLARQQRIAGIEFTEFVPALDVRSLTALAIARLFSNVISLTEVRSPRPATVPTSA